MRSKMGPGYGRARRKSSFDFSTVGSNPCSTLHACVRAPESAFAGASSHREFPAATRDTGRGSGGAGGGDWAQMWGWRGRQSGRQAHVRDHSYVQNV
jgi:hypothetical protein